MGVGLNKGWHSYQHTLRENLEPMKKKPQYPFNDGKFGIHNPGSGNVYNIYVDGDPVKAAKAFWDEIADGGTYTIYNENQKVVKMKDGTYIGFRITTKSDLPAVDINVSYSNDPDGLKSQKIHFSNRKRQNHENTR